MRMRSWSRLGLMIVWIAAVPVALRAADDPLGELLRVHREVVGGAERIEALHSLRASGSVVTGGKKVRFTMIAARPNKIRLQTDVGGRTLVQVSDGMEPPWEYDTGAWPPTYKKMDPVSAKTFAADAEFDDPLIVGEGRGFVFEYLGQKNIDGEKMDLVQVNRKGESPFTLYVNESYSIVRRVEQRTSVSGRALDIVTFYEDYGPVSGVMMPHKVVVAVNGQITQQTVLETIEANTELTPETFAMPKPVTPSSRHK